MSEEDTFTLFCSVVGRKRNVKPDTCEKSSMKVRTQLIRAKTQKVRSVPKKKLSYQIAIIFCFGQSSLKT